VTETDIFDAAAIRRHRSRAAATIATIAPILDELAAPMLDRLDDTKTIFKSALDLGGRGAIAPALQSRGMTVISADLSPAIAAFAGGLPVAIDGEALPFADKIFDLIIAHLSLHWINDLPGALIQLRRALKPGGLFLASMPVLGTLAELRTALLTAEHSLTNAVNPRVSPFPDLRDCAGLLQRAGFAAPVADMQETRLIYATPLTLFRELRAAGETNAVIARSRTIPPRALLPLGLASLAAATGKIEVTLKMAIMTGWA
jgi:NADH dehydrogenase [ubiquinone] 1 alpha subcomplex assembly factor 5